MKQNLEENAPEKCYLISSKAFSKDEFIEIFEEDDMERWNDMITLDGAEPNFIEGVKYLMIPYKISFVKVMMNYDYFVDPYPYLITVPYLNIAPSLKRIKPIQDNIPLGYPHWFAISFPDVLFWAMSEINQIYVRNIIKIYPEGSVNSGRYLDVKEIGRAHV